MARTTKTAAAADAAGDGQSGANPGPTINGIVPTPLEVRFIFALIANLKHKPEVNWDELANAMGLAGKKSAYERWRLIRLRFGINLADEAETPGGARKGAAAKKAATAAKAAAAAKDNAADEDGEDENDEDAKPAPVTPAKRGRKAASATAATPGSAAGKKRAAAAATLAGAGAAASDAEETASPAKKVRGKTAAAKKAEEGAAKKAEEGATKAAAPADGGEDSSPRSPAPEMTADEASGDGMEV